MGSSGEAEDDDVIPLMSNQICCLWPSREKYLSAHYELLRNAVAYERENPSMTILRYESTKRYVLLLRARWYIAMAM